jgi:2'-5' RNA ligase
MPAAQAVASSLRAAAFALALDRVGSFRRSRVAWAAASAPPPALVAMQSALEQGLRASGFELEERPFRPHVTLARKTQERVPLASIVPIAWACDEVALVVSDLASGEYRTLESWPLGRDGGR